MRYPRQIPAPHCVTNSFLNCFQTQIHDNIPLKHKHYKSPLLTVCFNDFGNFFTPVHFSDFCVWMGRTDTIHHVCCEHAHKLSRLITSTTQFGIVRSKKNYHVSRWVTWTTSNAHDCMFWGVCIDRIHLSQCVTIPKASSMGYRDAVPLDCLARMS